MAIYTAWTETPVTLTASATRSCMEVLGDADVSARLVEFAVSMNGVSATAAPVLVKLVQITATGTGTACTEANAQRMGKTAPQCQAKHTLTVEPTKVASVALGSWYVHPQGGLLHVQYPLGREPYICDGVAAQGLAVELTVPAGVTNQAVCHISWEE